MYAEAVTFRTIDDLEAALRAADYLPDRGLATALFLSLALEKPVLLEGVRRFKRREMLRVALADIAGEIDVAQWRWYSSCLYSNGTALRAYASRVSS